MKYPFLRHLYNSPLAFAIWMLIAMSIMDTVCPGIGQPGFNVWTVLLNVLGSFILSVLWAKILCTIHKYLNEAP